MTVKNAADWRSEEKRRRKRRAINVHLHRQHQNLLPKGMEWQDFLKGKTTEDRLWLHYEHHLSGEADHGHPTGQEWDDWEALEKHNATQKR